MNFVAARAGIHFANRSLKCAYSISRCRLTDTVAWVDINCVAGRIYGESTSGNRKGDGEWRCATALEHDQVAERISIQTHRQYGDGFGFDVESCDRA